MDDSGTEDKHHGVPGDPREGLARGQWCGCLKFLVGWSQKTSQRSLLLAPQASGNVDMLASRMTRSTQ